jgi:peptidoglycan/LPS O-acetylase OafA/YrhL
VPLARADRYRPDIDGLRALAVALVIAQHSVPQRVPGGFLGVDVFFVISGYLITRLLLRELDQGRLRLGDFYRRRVRRILPPLLLMLTTCLAVGWYTLLPDELRLFGQSLSWCGPFLANAFFARSTGYFDPSAEFNVLLHLWSLGVEEQFYLVWPLLLLWAVRAGVRDAVLLAVFSSSLLICLWGGWNAPLPHYYQPAPRAWELVAGALLASRTLHTGAPPLRAASAASLAGLALIAGAALLLGAEDRFPGLWGIAPTAGAVLLLAAGPGATVNRGLLATPPLVWLGRRSYGLYLWHWPLLTYAHIVLGRRLSPPVLLAVLLLALLFASASYRWVERPLRRGALGRAAVPALLAGLAALSLLGPPLASGHIAGRLSGPAFSAWDAAVTDWQIGGSDSIDPRTGYQTLQLPGRLPHTTLFIGDSHLQQYWPRIAQLLASSVPTRSVLFLAYAGCPMLPGVNVLRQPRDCAGFFEYASAQARRPEVDTVVIGCFWELYFAAEYQLGRQQLPYRAGDPLRRPLRLDSAAGAALLNEYTQLLRAWVNSGRRVFLILPSPTSPQFEPAALVPARLRLGLQTTPAPYRTAPRSIDSTAYERFVAPLRGRLLALAAASGASVLEPRDSLCTAALCPAVGSDGEPLYIDSNHLRAAYARAHASFLDVTLWNAAAREQQEQVAACQQLPAPRPLPCSRSDPRHAAR